MALRRGMAQALSSGAVDLVGLARSLAMEPGLPNRLLSGQEPGYRVQPIRTGIEAIDRRGLLEIAWYTGQLKRMGHGRAPQPNESALWVFARQALRLLALRAMRRGPIKLRAN